jgi:hypothetical protein
MKKYWDDLSDIAASFQLETVADLNKIYYSEITSPPTFLLHSVTLWTYVCLHILCINIIIWSVSKNSFSFYNVFITVCVASKSHSPLFTYFFTPVMSRPHSHHLGPFSHRSEKQPRMYQHRLQSYEELSAWGWSRPMLRQAFVIFLKCPHNLCSITRLSLFHFVFPPDCL